MGGNEMVRSHSSCQLLLVWFILCGVFLFPGNASIVKAEDLASDNPAAISASKQQDLPASTYSDIWKSIDERTSMVSSISAYYSYSDQVGGADLDGGGFNAILAPTYTLNEEAVFICLYNGSYYKKLDFYSDEVGTRVKTQSTPHTITPMFRFDLDDQDRYSFTPSIFHTQSYNIDVEGGDWGDGLYNYEDLGIGFNFRAKNFGSGNARGALNLGMQYYQRDYPNFFQLLPYANDGEKIDERDYQGVLLRAGYNFDRASGLSWGAGYFYLAKNLDSNKLVEPNGAPDPYEEQRDTLEGVDLRLSYVPLSMNQLRLGLDLSGSFNRSNQSHFDLADPLNPGSENTYIEKFYDYNAYRVASHITFSWSTLPVTARVSYAYKDTEYTGRLAQNAEGQYKDKKQAEESSEVDAEVRYNFMKQWNAYLRYQYLRVNSNNDNEEVYLYNHQVNTYSAGVSFSY